MPSLIALLTDFGLQDSYVGAMKGVIAGIAPQAQVIDLSHAVPPQDVQAAAFALLTSYDDFPSGTIFCCVVDPEVGSGRAAVALRLEPYTFVFPDNGLLTPLLHETSAVRAVHLDRPEYHHSKASRTFHGRDVFAPVSAHLAVGASLDELGSPFDPSGLRRLEWPEPHVSKDGFTAQVLHVDRFGNLVTNLEGWRLEPPLHRWQVRCSSTTVTGIATTFAEVRPGEAVAYIGSSGYLELALRQDSAADAWGVRRGAAVRVQHLAEC